jgi:hypothetical protein
MYTESVLLIKVLLVVGIHELRVLRKTKRSSVMRLANGSHAGLAATCVSKGSVNNIINALGYAKVCARWVPRSLTDDQKTVRKEVFSDLLSHYEADGESFLSRIVTGDEIWIHHLEPETKRQSVEWRHPTSPLRKKFKVTLQQGKSLPLFFLGAEGVILVDIMLRGQTINSSVHSDS